MEKLKKNELVLLAKKNKLKGYSKMNKAELIDALREASMKSDKIIEKSGAGQIAESSKFTTAEKVTRPFIPVPEYYDQDTIFLLPVEPDRHYVCWEISKFTREKFEQMYGEGNYAVRLISKFGNELAFQDVNSIGNWYFSAYAPFESVYAEIGLVDKSGVFHVILTSAQVVFPSDKVSDIIDTKWMLVGKEWQEVMELSGENEDAVFGTASEPARVLKKVHDNVSSDQSARRR